MSAGTIGRTCGSGYDAPNAEVPTAQTLEHPMADYLWFFTVAIAPFLVFAIVIYALLRRRRLTREEQTVRAEKTKELFEEER